MPFKPNKTVNYQDDEIKQLTFLQSLIDESQEYKKEVAAKYWDDNLKMMEGEHWPTKRPTYKAAPVVNFIYKLIERGSGLLTDSKPEINIQTASDKLTPVNEALKIIIETNWDENEIQGMLSEAVFHCQSFGTVGFETLWDDTMDYGQGDIRLDCIDPRDLDIDPFVTSPRKMRDAEYIVRHTVKPFSYCTWKWPKRAEDIRPDAGSRSKGESESKDTGIFDSSGRRIYRWGGGDSKGTVSAIPRCKVQHFYFKYRDEVNDATKDGKLGLKYPGGVYVIVAGGVVVYRSANPYWDSKFPTDVMNWNWRASTIWGKSEVEILKEAQKHFNKMMALIMENAMMMGNAIWIGDEDALDPKGWNDLVSKPGLLVKKRTQRELRREYPEPLPAYMFQTLEGLKYYMEDLVDQTGLAKGTKTGQLQSGIGFETAQMAAQVIVRLKARALESVLNSIGQKYISRIFQYYTDDRILWLAGDSEQAKALQIARKYIEDNYPGEKIKNAFRDYKFRIKPGSSLALSKWQQIMLAMQLAESGLIDGLEVLKTIGWPDREKVYERAKMERIMGISPAAVVGKGQKAIGKSSRGEKSIETAIQEARKEGGM
ncbi:MAG: hypothetical protein SV062_08130 [Thermodesulfobacteriota bacterium]|nr:hypothetical protein [Thermodesulfobacteriota bacterium]